MAITNAGIRYVSDLFSHMNETILRISELCAVLPVNHPVIMNDLCDKKGKKSQKSVNATLRSPHTCNYIISSFALLSASVDLKCLCHGFLVH